ncbi:MAG TPA: hypothetical protein VF601_05350 [Beijerinckiaceae bacterium]|jgi:uncharacterized repeat protein (TIGR01451 family)
MAGTIDLTVAGASGNIGGAIFTNEQAQPAGTGVFDSFVQIQHSGSEQGYNTSAQHQFDETTSLQHNHSILLADVPIVFGDGTNGTEEGVAYREFLLDANDPSGSSNRLSLDKLQIWQEESGSLNNFTPGTGFAGAHTNYLAYNLDAGGDRWVAINAALSSGSGGSDMRLLIPDSFFINDAAHRYVTLYSAFGLQGGTWGTDGGFEEWGLTHASGGAKSALVVNKSATVPGGTADTVGEVIDYTITVANTGNTALTGLTVADPAVSNLAPVLSGGFNIGDTNQDGNLGAGETWRYTANHTVTQDDLDSNGGGDGVIENIATADTDQTAPVTASAVVAVDQRRQVDLVKTADVTSVDGAGDVITYTVTVTNTGNTTLTNPVVTDPQVTHTTPILDFNAPILGAELLAGVLNGDYNVGDLNQNGFEDPAIPPGPGNPTGTPAEVFVFVNAGDTNQNGVQDPGETFEFANAGDTNQNGAEDTGETFQYYNAGDTNHNGVEDDGETFQIIVSHELTGADTDNDGFNDGDVNHDDRLNVGETWTYNTASHTLTQDEIDNGGVVDPGLSIDNTASVTTNQNAGDSGSVSVTVDQNPHVTLVKTATVPGGTADAAGEVIHYDIAITNDGNMTLTTPVVSDPSIGNLAGVDADNDTFNDGDTDQDGKLDLGETWAYTGSHTLTQAEIDNGGVVDSGLSIDNTASVTTGQGATASDSVSVTIEQNPHVTLVKTATVPGGTADAAGEVIAYAITVTNDGNMTLTNPVVSDPSASGLAGVDANSDTFNDGDTNHDGKLGIGETWQYTASHMVTQPEMDAGGTIDNTASVATNQGASASDDASVTVEQRASIMLDKAGTFNDEDQDGFADVGETIGYVFTVTNTGNVTQHNAGVADLDGNVAVTGSTIASLAPGASDSSWTGTYTIQQTDVDAGSFENTAVVQSDEASDPDTEIVTLPQDPGGGVPDITLDKIGTFNDVNHNGFADLGDTISFVFKVTNTGTATLHNIGVADLDGNTAVTGSTIASLAPGASDSSWTGSHAIDQADLDAGSFENTAVAISDEVSDPDTETVTLSQAPPPQAVQNPDWLFYV